MQIEPPHPSVASIGPDVGALAERHMILTFRRMRDARVASDQRFFRIITGEAHPFGNMTLISDPTDVDAVRAAVGPLTDCGAPAAALFIGAVSHEVDAALRAAGFEPHEDMPAMAIDIDRQAPAPAPDGCVLQRFHPGERDDEWIDAFAAGYEIPRGVAALFSPGAMEGATGDSAPLQFFGAIMDGRIVATSFLAMDDGVAGMYGVATLPERRGMGLGAFVTAEPLRIARKLGYRVGALQSSEAGHGVYTRLGFADCGVIPLFVRTPS